MKWILLISFLLAPRTWADDWSDGEKLTRIAGCTDCHTTSPDKPMAGGLPLLTPFGTFYPPNISPDRRTGIGRWTEQMFREALRFGISPTGSYYYPVFPYRSYSKMTDDDIRKIYLYLNTLPATTALSPPHQIHAPFDQRWLLFFWQSLYFRGARSNAETNIKIARGPFTPSTDQSPEWNRGAYLVEALAHCTECHTPRNDLGGLEVDQWMAGAGNTIPGKVVPNITPDLETGLGVWTVDNWNRFLASGITPDGSTPEGEMVDVIQNVSTLSRDDRDAIVTYLRSLPPVRHRPDLEK